ncbi:hypothetical protein FOCC_FOCC015294 [Frankliniella occidentalis]|nr:hypothetical protein FOCC_FOCC015294 [Frankliniella occidentalis]
MKVTDLNSHQLKVYEHIESLVNNIVLKLPDNSKFGFNTRPVSGVDLVDMRVKFQNLKFVFIDEFSMVGLKMLALIKERCRLITENDHLFGKIHLLPIGDQPLYAEVDTLVQHNTLLERGKLIIDELSQAYILKKCHRFANAKRVANGKCTEEDVDEMRKRCLSFLSPEVINSFSSSIRLCSTNESANEFNLTILKINAKVMLRKNLNVSRGLVNGCVGTVKTFIYEYNNYRPPALPVCVLVQFDNVDLTGCDFNYVPIKPYLSMWFRNGVTCTRFQLPLALCWACTIHKSQGLTLLRVILDAGQSEFALGLLYVALSRVSDKNSLALVSALSIERLNSLLKRRERQKLYMRIWRSRFSYAKRESIRLADRKRKRKVRLMKK